MDSEDRARSREFLRLEQLEKADLIQELLDAKSEARFHIIINVLAFLILFWVTIINFLGSFF